MSNAFGSPGRDITNFQQPRTTMISSSENDMFSEPANKYKSTHTEIKTNHRGQYPSRNHQEYNSQDGAVDSEMAFRSRSQDLQGSILSSRTAYGPSFSRGSVASSSTAQSSYPVLKYGSNTSNVANRAPSNTRQASGHTGRRVVVENSPLYFFGSDDYHEHKTRSSFANRQMQEDLHEISRLSHEVQSRSRSMTSQDSNHILANHSDYIEVDGKEDEDDHSRPNHVVMLETSTFRRPAKRLRTNNNSPANFQIYPASPMSNVSITSNTLMGFAPSGATPRPTTNASSASAPARAARHPYVPNAAGMYACPECPKIFASSSSVNRHVRGIHDQIKDKCDTCGRTFADKRRRDGHQKNPKKGQCYLDWQRGRYPNHTDYEAWKASRLPGQIGHVAPGSAVPTSWDQNPQNPRSMMHPNKLSILRGPASSSHFGTPSSSNARRQTDSKRNNQDQGQPSDAPTNSGSFGYSNGRTGRGQPTTHVIHYPWLDRTLHAPFGFPGHSNGVPISRNGGKSRPEGVQYTDFRIPLQVGNLGYHQQMPVDSSISQVNFGLVSHQLDNRTPSSTTPASRHTSNNRQWRSSISDWNEPSTSPLQSALMYSQADPVSTSSSLRSFGHLEASNTPFNPSFESHVGCGLSNSLSVLSPVESQIISSEPSGLFQSSQVSSSSQYGNHGAVLPNPSTLTPYPSFQVAHHSTQSGLPSSSGISSLKQSQLNVPHWRENESHSTLDFPGDTRGNLLSHGLPYLPATSSSFSEDIEVVAQEGALPRASLNSVGHDHALGPPNEAFEPSRMAHPLLGEVDFGSTTFSMISIFSNNDGTTSKGDNGGSSLFSATPSVSNSDELPFDTRGNGKGCEIDTLRDIPPSAFEDGSYL